MAKTEIKLVTEYGEQDLLDRGVDVSQFQQHAESLTEGLLDGYVRSRKGVRVFPDIPSAKRWFQLTDLYHGQIDVFLRHTARDSLINDLNKSMIPIAESMVNLREGDGGDYANEDEEVEELWALDDDGSTDREAIKLPEGADSAIKVGAMFIMHDAADQLLRISESTAKSEEGVVEGYRVYQNRILFSRAGEILVRVNGVCLSDISNTKKREKVSLLDQYQLLVNLLAARNMDPQQAEVGVGHSVVTAAHFQSAAKIVDLLLDPPIKSINEGLKSAKNLISPDEKMAADRFVAVSDHVAKIRSAVLTKLTDPTALQSAEIRKAIEDGLSSDEDTQVAVRKFLKLDQPESVFNIYRQAIRAGDVKLAGLLKEQSLNLDKPPYLLEGDLGRIYDPSLEVDSVYSVDSEQLQEIVKATKLKQARNFSFEGEDLLFAGIDYGQMRLPQRIDVRFDANLPFRRFVLSLGYTDTNQETLTHALEFDLLKGGLIDWRILNTVSEPEMARLYQASMALTRSVLGCIKQQCDTRAREGGVVKVSRAIVKPCAPSKKGPHVPAPKFVNDSPKKPESLLSAPLVTTEDKTTAVRDVIVIPKGDKLARLLKGLKGHPKEVIDTVIEQMLGFNNADVQVGIEPLKNAKRSAPVSKWGCNTSIGEVRALLVRAGFKETEKGRTRFWEPAVVGRRAGFYRELADKYGFDSKDV